MPTCVGSCRRRNGDFLLHLKSAIPEINTPGVTLMSDRDKGLSSASDSILHQTNRAFCTQHISDNVYQTFRKTARDLFRKIAASRTPAEYFTCLEDLRNHSKPAAKYMEDLPRANIALHFFQVVHTVILPQTLLNQSIMRFLKNEHYHV